MNCVGRCILPLIWGICGVSAVGQDTWSQQQFMSENGLLQNRVHAMVRDGWGALLIGTEGGLVRFDGNHFKQIGLPAQEGIRPSRVLDILPTANREYVVRDAGCRQYVYAKDQLMPLTADAPTRQFSSRFSGGVPTVHVALNAMDPDSVMSGKEDWSAIVRPVLLSDGTWCARNEKELLVYSDTALVSRYPLPQGRSPHLFMLGEGLFTLDRSGHAHRINALTGEVVPVTMVGFPDVESRNGSLGWRIFWDALDRTALMVSRDSLYVIRDRQGGAQLEAEFIPLQLPSDAKVGSMVWMDEGEVLAVGTGTKGLFIYRKNTMRSLLCDVTMDGVNNAYNAQAPFGDAQVFSSTRGGARLFSSLGCDQEIPPIKGFDEAAILLDEQQRYWYGRGDTLFQYDALTKEEHHVRTGIKPLCFFEEADTVWIGTAKGIYHMSAGSIVLKFPLSEGELSTRPNALIRTADGELWMATCSGVFKANRTNGWENVPALSGICARTLAVHHGAVLVGAYGSGAFFHRNGVTRRFPPDEQGFLSHVHGFMPDSMGFLWMSTNQGLFRAKWNDLEVWSRDTTERIFYAYYGKQAGIQNSEFNGGCSPPYVRTRNGWASFPTMDGLVWFKPEGVPDAFPSGRIMVEGVFVDDRRMGEDLTLAWDHKEVLVRFSIAYWGDPENVRLEYNLEGITDDRWIPLPTGQRELRFGRLPFGDHGLRLRKIGGVLRGEEPLMFRFIVPTPFFRTPWFLATCVVAVALLLYFVVRLNAARLRRKNLVLEQKVRERTRELVETNTVLRRSLEMKEMLVSIISHDIVTPLRFIARVANGASGRMGNGSDERLTHTLVDLARSSDKLHANAQGLLNWIKRQDGRIDLRPRNVVVNLLVADVFDMERERAVDNDVDLSIEIDLEDTIRTDRNVLSIVLHNLVANAVTHSAGATVTVHGLRSDGAYILTVRDTGLGMPAAALRHAQRVQSKGALGAMNDEGERDVQGLGLLIVADLLQLLGGTFSVESQPEVGTTIVVVLPEDIPVPFSSEATFLPENASIAS